MKKTMLIVEDEELIRNMLKGIFERNGYTVVTAEDGEKGLAIATTAKLDIIITDNDMPTMDGISMVREIRQIDAKIPIIFSSGMMDEEREVQATKAGVTFILPKPYTIQEMVSTANHLLQA